MLKFFTLGNNPWYENHRFTGTLRFRENPAHQGQWAGKAGGLVWVPIGSVPPDTGNLRRANPFTIVNPVDGIPPARFVVDKHRICPFADAFFASPRALWL